MNAVDEFARVRDEIKRLKAREQELRQAFLDGAQLRSNAHEVVVKTQKRRVFLRDRLPQSILRDDQFWDLRETQIVSVKALDDDIILVEDE